MRFFAFAFLLATTTVLAVSAVQLDPRDRKLPSWSRHHQKLSSHHPQKSSSSKQSGEGDGGVYHAARITFYAGNQLNNPSCGGPTPSRNSMIAAVHPGGRWKCGDKINIKSGSKQITVTAVDLCPACDGDSLDLTPGAFAKLADLSVGVIKGATLSHA